MTSDADRGGGNQEVKTEREVTRRCKSSGVQVMGPVAEGKCGVVRRRMEEAVGKALARGTRSAYRRLLGGGGRKLGPPPRVRVPPDPKPDVTRIWRS